MPKAKAILIRELGPVDYARFIQQYEEGTGNYTADRHQWLGGESARTLHEQASQLAANGELPRPARAKLFSPTD
jgi:N-dimethylarginine dimethylaminohydrolase